MFDHRLKRAIEEVGIDTSGLKWDKDVDAELINKAGIIFH